MYSIGATSEAELDRAAFERLRARHPERLRRLIIEDAKALGLIVAEPKEWETLGAFIARIGISHDTFSRRMARPFRPPGFQTRAGESGRIIEVQSNAIADQWFRGGEKSAGFCEIAGTCPQRVAPGGVAGADCVVQS